MQPASPRLRVLLERPTLARWLVALSLLLCLPTFGTGLQLDDLLHKALLRKLPPHGEHGQGLLRLFTFFDGEPARNRRLTAEGLFPWWTADDLRLSFFRPLSALTHGLDYALWSDAPWLMHLHNWLWFAAALALATHLFRSLIPTAWVAGLASLMFALHEAHAIPATWIANRNAAIALFFGLLTLALHRRRSLLAVLAFAAALGAGESALATVALLVGHALFLEEPRARRRLLLYVPVLALWALLYRRFGFGTAGSGLYIDPGAEPLRFAAIALERLPLQLVGTIFPTDAVFFLPRPAALAIVLACWVVVVLVGLFLAPVVRARRTARFFAFVMVAAALPGCATIPAGRLLVFAIFGAMGLFAEAIEARGARAILILRVWAAPVFFLFVSFQIPMGGALVARFERSLPADATEDVILVTSFDAAGSGYAGLLRSFAGRTPPSHIHVMALGDRPVAVTRVDARTLLVRPRDGFLADNFSRLFRRRGFVVGERVEWVHATIEVVEVNAEGRALAARFTFREPLEWRGYRFMSFAGKALAPFALPRPGETVTIAPGVLL